VQTTLLGLSIAFIIALIAALIGPYFIDWNQFRPQFETEATRVVGAPVRVVFVELKGKQRWVMVNPEITDVGSEDFLVWDDCFSFPNLLVRVTRAYRATLTYQDLEGESHAMELEGPMAELLQHEIDHLDGILAVDRASGNDPFAFRSEWEKLHDTVERYGLPKPREVNA